MANSIQTPPTYSSPTAKRRKLTHHNHHSNHQEQQQQLIPGLPNHIAQICLSLVHPSTLYFVCHLWRRLIFSPSFPPFLSLYALLSPTNTTHDTLSNSIQFFNFDPISSRWGFLPPPPPDPPLRLLLRHPSFISRDLPIQCISVSGYLILLAASTDNFSPALSRPLVFNPLSHTWVFGPPLATPRRWCAAGSVQGAVYVASGIGSHYSTDLAKSVEKWDLQNKKNASISAIVTETSNINDLNSKNNNIDGCMWRWDRVKGLKDGRFSRDAIDAIGWRGKLCMVNMKGYAAKEGLVYNTEKDEWEDMPEGMLTGWKGPVAAMDEEIMYVVDETNGALRKYDPERDHWDQIMESEKLVGAQQIAAGGGRVCVICGGSEIVVMDVVAVPVRLWVVETPPGFEALSIHILPRMSRPDF